MLLAAALLLQMACHFFPDAVHEALGMGLAVLAMVHVAINRRWFAQLALAAWGAYELVDLGLLDYITLRTRFAFIDTSRPLGLYLLPMRRSWRRACGWATI